MALVWVSKATVFAIHDQQLAEHGGAPGLRDEGLLDSALARPLNLAVYGSPSLAELAAAYAVGMVQNHPFVDGNKRASLVVTELFLALNGFELVADDFDCVFTWQALADGSLSEVALAKWLDGRIAPV